MIDREQLEISLARAGLETWTGPLCTMIGERLAATGHGDFSRWQDAVERVRADSGDNLRSALLDLSPWRKGPFEIGGIRIDSEWRSDLKWSRVRDAIAPLEGRRILDVGCCNA